MIYKMIREAFQCIKQIGYVLLANKRYKNGIIFLEEK